MEGGVKDNNGLSPVEEIVSPSREDIEQQEQRGGKVCLPAGSQWGVAESARNLAESEPVETTPLLPHPHTDGNASEAGYISDTPFYPSSDSEDEDEYSVLFMPTPSPASGFSTPPEYSNHVLDELIASPLTRRLKDVIRVRITMVFLEVLLLLIYIIGIYVHLFRSSEAEEEGSPNNGGRWGSPEDTLDPDLDHDTSIIAYYSLCGVWSVLIGWGGICAVRLPLLLFSLST